MSDKIDWLKRLRLLEIALSKDGVRTNLMMENRSKEIVYALDFSEHDKVFKDKIELLNRNLNLQKDKRCEEEIERNYLAGRFSQLKGENDELKQRIAELESFITQAEQDSTSLIFDLQQRIVELENESDNCGNAILSEIDTSNPLACAKSLIEHTIHCEKFMTMPERDVQTFYVEELKEIADYLMVYYRHHRDRDEENIAL